MMDQGAFAVCKCHFLTVQSNQMKQAHLSADAPAPIGPYSQAIQAGKTL
jgi:hypothetical protein